jgi:hypothetical protein
VPDQQAASFDAALGKALQNVVKAVSESLEKAHALEKNEGRGHAGLAQQNLLR